MPNHLCAVPGCKGENSRFKFPAEPQLREQWCLAIKRFGWKPKKTSSVCFKHFKASDFRVHKNSLSSIGGRQLRRLKEGAIPSVEEVMCFFCIESNLKQSCNFVMYV